MKSACEYDVRGFTWFARWKMSSATAPGGSGDHHTTVRPRMRAGRAVNIKDWEKQNELLSKWNDGNTYTDFYTEK